eukprot:scaffold31327_cov79-Isochrysis_galbana.AAC.1
MPPPLHGRGVLVAGVPIGDAHYVDTVLARIAADTESYILKTVTELRCDPHAAWTSLYYAAQHRFDFFLRHLPPAVTDAYARNRGKPQLGRWAFYWEGVFGAPPACLFQLKSASS